MVFTRPIPLCIKQLLYWIALKCCRIHVEPFKNTTTPTWDGINRIEIKCHLYHNKVIPKCGTETGADWNVVHIAVYFLFLSTFSYRHTHTQRHTYAHTRACVIKKIKGVHTHKLKFIKNEGSTTTHNRRIAHWHNKKWT